MPRYKEQNRVTPDYVENMRLEPQAAPVDKTVKRVFDENRFRNSNGALEGLAVLGKGTINIEDTLVRKANENVLNAEYNTQEENKNKWSEVSRNVKGMAKFNPYNDDAFRRIVAGNITSQKIAEMKSIPEIKKLDPSQAAMKFGEVASSMTEEYGKAGLEPNDVYYSLDRFDKERKQFEQRQIIEHAQYAYEKTNILRTYDLSNNIQKTIYNYDNFDKIAHAGMLEQGNIDINNRKVVNNPNGTISTEKTITIEQDDSYVLLPTIIDGKEVSQEEAIKHYEETGEHLGKFESQETADFYADELHHRQAYFYGNRDKAGAILGYMAKNTNQLISEGTPDDTIAKISLDAMKQAVTQNPEMLTSPEWERILNDYTINGKVIGQLLPNAAFEMRQFVQQAKRAALDDMKMDWEKIKLHDTMGLYNAMKDYYNNGYDSLPIAQQETKLRELITQYGLEGVATELLNEGYNLRTALARANTTITDPEFERSIMVDYFSGNLSKDKIVNGLLSGKLSKDSALVWIQNADKLEKAEVTAVTKQAADIYKQSVKTYIEGDKATKQRAVLSSPAVKQAYVKKLNDIRQDFENDHDLGRYKQRVNELNQNFANEKAIVERAKMSKQVKGLSKMLYSPYISDTQYDDYSKNHYNSQQFFSRFKFVDVGLTEKTPTIVSNPSRMRKFTITDPKTKRLLTVNRAHKGIDWGGTSITSGRPLYAPNGGRVLASQWINGYGYCVIIQDPRGFCYKFAHMQNAGRPSVGTILNGRSRVGYVGTTGAVQSGSTGSIHMEFYTTEGGWINPKKIL